jgi:symplekin
MRELPNMASQDPQAIHAAMQPLLSARAAALENPELYNQVLPPVLGLMSEKPSIIVRRWVAAFIAEALSSAAVHPDEKERIVLMVLPAIKGFLEAETEDEDIIKNAVVAAASAYPIGFRHVVYHPEDTETWQNLQTIKIVILQRMDSYPPATKACCVKFVQRVVQTQTPGVIDPRRPDKNETSLALVPRDHPLMSVPNVEAETSGLLDRILGVLQDESR